MKILSLNVRGLGDRAKRRRIRSLIISGKFDCAFFQETKCSAVNNQLIGSLWGGGTMNMNGLQGVLLVYLED